MRCKKCGQEIRKIGKSTRGVYQYEGTLCGCGEKWKRKYSQW